MEDLIQAIVSIDRRLFLTVNRRQVEKLNGAIMAITSLGGISFQILLAAVLLTFPSGRSLGTRLVVNQILVASVVQLLKALVGRNRPYNALHGIIPFKTEQDFSFPSGHTAASFATALLLTTGAPSFSALFFALAALIGFSRIYIGVHYPSDVFTGCLIGTILTALLLLIGV